ncbi:MAG: hypothetical protein ACI353_06560 [Alloprevotella sp.]
MKTHPTHPASSSADIRLPRSWQELTSQQLHHTLQLLADDHLDADSRQLLLLLHLAEIHIIHRHTDTLIATIGRQGAFRIPVSQLTAAMLQLDFIREPPRHPQRPDQWEGTPAVDPELHGIPFGEYLQLDNHYRQYILQPQEEQHLQAIAAILYPTLPASCATPAHPDYRTLRYLLLHWMTGLKTHLARIFPHLYTEHHTTAEERPSDTWTAETMREAMLAQIRALTGGDVTKEHDVLNVDTWTALAELDAKAREAAQLRK